MEKAKSSRVYKKGYFKRAAVHSKKNIVAGGFSDNYKKKQDINSMQQKVTMLTKMTL